MNSLVEERVKGFLQNKLRCNPYDCGAILFKIRTAARVAGHDLDRNFGFAGLSAGPDANVGSYIVDRALGGGAGSAVDEYVLKQTLERWVRTTPQMGM